LSGLAGGLKYEKSEDRF